MKLSLAPMLDVTTPHFRKLIRLTSQSTTLFTEMIVDLSILNMSPDKLDEKLGPYDPNTVVQIGGSNKITIANAIKTIQLRGFTMFNLNCGCPSSKVQKGCFGAVLMKDPGLVCDIVNMVYEQCGVILSIKCRIGVDDEDSFEFFHRFVSMLYENTPTRVFYIHARKCILDGLSPHGNRTVPPLNYEFAYRIKEMYGDLEVHLNGGIKEVGDLERIGNLDGIMIGRRAMKDVLVFKTFEEEILKITAKTDRSLRSEEEVNVENVKEKILLEDDKEKFVCESGNEKARNRNEVEETKKGMIYNIIENGTNCIGNLNTSVHYGYENITKMNNKFHCDNMDCLECKSTKFDAANLIDNINVTKKMKKDLIQIDNEHIDKNKLGKSVSKNNITDKDNNIVDRIIDEIIIQKGMYQDSNKIKNFVNKDTYTVDTNITSENSIQNIKSGVNTHVLYDEKEKINNSVENKHCEMITIGHKDSQINTKGEKNTNEVYVRELIFEYLKSYKADTMIKMHHVLPLIHILKGMKGCKEYKITLNGIVKNRITFGETIQTLTGFFETKEL